MALYSKEKKFIFVHIYKCAGNSIGSMLRKTNDVIEIHNAHTIIRDVKKYFYEDIKEPSLYADSYKFSFVRNPYSMMVSLYFYIRVATGHEFHSKIYPMSFAEFLFWYKDKLNEKYKYGAHGYFTLLDFLNDEEKRMEMDYVGKIENIETDFGKISSQLGIVCDKIPMMNVKRGKFYDSNYKKYYSNLSKNLVRQMFEKDLDYFNYIF